MQRLIQRWFRTRSIRCPRHVVERAVERHDVQRWFADSLRQRDSRWELWQTCFWIADHCRSSTAVLETACGIGTNLLWLGQNGFSELQGFDIDPRAVACGQELAGALRVPSRLWCDDGINPSAITMESADVILVMNWLMLIPDVDLAVFLSRYSDILRENGVLFLDVIDRSYDAVPNNQYLTSDWNKPVAERAVTEYQSRFTYEDVHRACVISRFHIDEVWQRPQLVPKRVYRLVKRA